MKLPPIELPPLNRVTQQDLAELFERYGRACVEADRAMLTLHIEAVEQKFDRLYQATDVYLDACAELTDRWRAACGFPPEETQPQDDPRDREIERLRAELVQIERSHREDMRQAAAEARHRERFPDEPPGTY